MNKYHFRRSRLSKNYPFIVLIVKEKISDDGKTYLTGFNITSSALHVLEKPNNYIRINNPNPNDDIECYACVEPIKDRLLKYFSKPIQQFVLSNEDEKKIDELVNQTFY